MVNKRICKTFLTAQAAMALCLLSFEADAQFNKYKSKSSYSKPTKDKKSITSILNDKNSAGNQAKDSFGRSKNVISRNSQSSKYVNLNPETAFGPEVITSFDFPNTSIIDLVEHMQKLTGINFIYDEKIKGKVNISAPTPITVGDAWRAFETALSMNGLFLVQSGAFYRIVNQKDIKYTKTNIYTGNYTPDTDRFIMKIIPLKNINGKEVERAFRPFNSRQGRIYTIQQTNTLIIQDTGSNISRLVKLIKFIDVPGHEESLQIIKVRNSSAEEIVAILEKILAKQTRTSKVTTKSTNSASIGKLTAEPRTNSIIAMTNGAGADQLRTIIKRLDVDVMSSGSGKIHVYYLNHSDAETLSKTLEKLVGSSASSKTSRFSKSLASKFNSGGKLFSNEVKVTSDKENNALVITASPTDYLTLKDVIDKLDIPRDQVFVEGMIMETSINKATGYGISIIGAYGSPNAHKAGFTGGSQDLSNMLLNTALPLGGFFAGGGIGGKVTQTLADGTTQTINSVNGLITAVATNNATNVLATPQIMTMDNEEGVFESGEKVPVATKTDAANGSSTTSTEMQSVTMTLKITPKINKVSRTIKMKIDQKLEDFSERKLAAAVADLGTGTVTRSIITNVTAKDKETIAMGGLMRDKVTDTESKVPFLGDIPVLGWLFKHKEKSTEKMNLLFFLTPKIVASRDKTSSKNVKDILNRRALHLKNTDSDPFKGVMKGLYEKAKREESGTSDEMNEFQRNNLEDGGIGSNTPNYSKVFQAVEQKKAAVSKGSN